MDQINPIQVVIGVWIGLFFLFLPFPTTLLPGVGHVLTALLLPITTSVSNIAPETLSQTFTFSDSLHLYLQTLVLGVASLFIAWAVIKKRKERQLLSFLRIGITYLLAFFLLKYGLEKWTRLQFPQPPPNILHAPTGSLTKDILFWSVMGSSKSYGWFMGFIEVLAGILLLLRKTRLIGGWLAFGIFLQIFALNIGFDITVKLLSFFLLSSSFYIIYPAISPLYQFLTGADQKNAIHFDNPDMKPIIRRLLKGSVLTIIFLECGLPLWNAASLPPQNQEGLAQQTYAIIESHPIPELFPSKNLKHIHFHPQGYLITESFNGYFTSYPIQLPSGGRQFTVKENSQTVRATRKNGEWYFTLNTKLLWRCKKVDNKKLPLMQDDFHWTVEGMLP